MGYAVELFAIAALIATGALFYVSQVGKPRDRITPGNAVVVLIIDAAVIVGLILAATHLLK